MNALQIQLADAEARLRAALIAGTHTSGIRAEIASIRSEIAREADAKAHAEAEAAQAGYEVIAQRAELIAAEASDRLANKIAALTAPAFP